MKVGVIGRGRVGQALGTALSDTHELRFGVRDPDGSDEESIAAAAAWADTIILATPWAAEAQITATIGPYVKGKTVIDATNPVGLRDGRLDLLRDATTPSLAERLPDAQIVKGFNQIGAEFIAETDLLERPPAMFFAADAEDAKTIALQIGTDAGFVALDGGPLSNARHLESLAMLWIWSAVQGPLGRSFGFTLSHRKD
ncbi:MAG: NAD(P)-binding domain-containing protein [Pseudomonadota bacterium]